MTRLRLFVATVALLAAARPASAALVERFATDPLGGRATQPFFAEGDVAARFTYLAQQPPRFRGDRPGALRVLYDTTLPTGRISTPLGQALALSEDVTFGAILTIRSEGFAADPNGFSQIAFGLWNAATTGMGRTLFPSDSYDLLEADYFPNVTEFGGPFLAPSIFGGQVGDNAFNNFTFQSAEVIAPFDVPLLCQARYEAATRRLTLTLNRHTQGPRFVPIPGAVVTLDLSRIDPTYLVDMAGIAAYGEGWPSLRAVVDFDLLYVGALPQPFVVGPRPGRTPVGTPPEPAEGRTGGGSRNRVPVPDRGQD